MSSQKRCKLDRFVSNAIGYNISVSAVTNSLKYSYSDNISWRSGASAGSLNETPDIQCPFFSTDRLKLFLVHYLLQVVTSDWFVGSCISVFNGRWYLLHLDRIDLDWFYFHSFSKRDLHNLSQNLILQTHCHHQAQSSTATLNCKLYFIHFVLHSVSLTNEWIVKAAFFAFIFILLKLLFTFTQFLELLCYHYNPLLHICNRSITSL